MNYKTFFTLIVLLLQTCLFTNCDKEISPSIENIPIVKELPTFYCKQNQNKLISSKEISNNILILNSAEETKNSFSKAFLESYPEYLQINYKDYTLLVQTTIVYYDIINRNIRFFFDKHLNFYRYQVDYLVEDICNENNFYIERTAIIINKIDSKTTIETGYSISKSTHTKKGL